jgi:flavin-dependent dehydrogenase
VHALLAAVWLLFCRGGLVFGTRTGQSGAAPWTIRSRAITVPMVRVVVSGGGVAGMATALLLRRRGQDVTVLERDRPPQPPELAAVWQQWERPGVPQFRQFHVFTARTRQTLVREFPDVHAALLDAGFIEAPMATRIRGLFPDAAEHEGDEEIVNLLGRRTTFEWVLRQAVEQAGVEVRLGGSVDGVIRSGATVTGVRCAGTEVPADVVVDATGRRAASDGWLADAGLPTGETVRSETGIVYYSRWYRLRPGADLAGLSLQSDVLSLRAVLTPADAGLFSLAFSVAVDDEALKALRRVSAFQAVAQALPRIGEWVRADRATPVTDVLFMGNLRNRHRMLIDEAHEPIVGIVAIGDASTMTNPVFGRGVALGLLDAVALDRVVDVADGPGDVCSDFSRHTEEVMRPWWEEGVRVDDLGQVWFRAARGADLAPSEEEMLATVEAKAQRAFPVAMTRDAELFRLVVRNLTSLDPPAHLHTKEVAHRAVTLVTPDEITTPAISRGDLLALLGST